jgi:hypothetical protein
MASQKESDLSKLNKILQTFRSVKEKELEVFKQELEKVKEDAKKYEQIKTQLVLITTIGIVTISKLFVLII